MTAKDARRRAGLTLAALWLAVTAAATLTPTGGGGGTPFFCLFCDARVFSDAFLNVGMFVPLGVALRMAGFSLRASVGISLAATVGIEAAQFQVVPGRDASLRDILTNAAGGALGAYLAPHLGTLALPRPAEARRLLVGTAFLFMATQAFTTWAFQPHRPEAPWWFQVTPERRQFSDVFPGQLLGFSLGGEALRVENSPGFHSSFEEGRGMGVTFAPGRATLGLAAIMRIVEGPDGGPSHEVALVGQEGRAVAFRYARAGESIGLYGPTLLVTPRPPGVTPDTVVAEGWIEGPALRLLVRSSGGTAFGELRPSAAWLWSLFLPSGARWYTRAAAVLASGWLAVLFGALGYWGRAALRGLGTGPGGAREWLRWALEWRPRRPFGRRAATVLGGPGGGGPRGGGPRVVPPGAPTGPAGPAERRAAALAAGAAGVLVFAGFWAVPALGGLPVASAGEVLAALAGTAAGALAGWGRAVWDRRRRQPSGRRPPGGRRSKA